MSLAAEAKQILGRLGAAPRKSYGQNFMVDPSTLAFICQALEIRPGEPVIEIGPGLGFLTRELAQVSPRLGLVEKDKKYAAFLENYFKGREVTVFQEDILHFSIPKSFTDGARIKVTGNIPYNITSPILEWLVCHRSSIKRAVLTVQKELAQRMCALPGTRLSGSLTLFLHYHAQVRILKIIPKNVFLPAPKVESAVVVIEFPDKPFYRTADEEGLFKLIRQAFQQRRKNLLNAILAYNTALSKVATEARIKSIGLDPTRRPETLVIDEWIALADCLRSAEAG